MRASCLPQFVVRTGTPEYWSSANWPVAGSWDDIAKWCFRVSRWKVSSTVGDFVFNSQMTREDRACLPVQDSGEMSGGFNIDPAGGYGAFFYQTLTGTRGTPPYDSPYTVYLVIGIGPSVLNLSFLPWPIFGPTRPDYFPDIFQRAPLILQDPSGGGLRLPLQIYLCRLSWTTGLYSIVGSAPDLVGGVPGSACTASFCGQNVPMFHYQRHEVYGQNFDDEDGYIDISPAAYFDYRKADGTEPIYNTATGEQLITPLPMYPPR